MLNRRRLAPGFTLIELLVALAILAVIIILLIFGLETQMGRARDSRRKADLERIKVAFEDYYNDNQCYPDSNILNNCGGSQLNPYLSKIPCDPQTKKPYLYVPDGGDQCKGYRLLTILEDKNDPVVAGVHCDNPCGCGYGGSYIYGVSAGIPLVADGCTPMDSSPIPSPSSSLAPGSSSPVSSPSGPVYVYACDPAGTCNRYTLGNVPSYCPTSYPTPQQCATACANSANRCTQ